MARPFLVVLLAHLSRSYAEVQGEVDVATFGMFLLDVPQEERKGVGRSWRSLRLRSAQVVPGVGVMALGLSTLTCPESQEASSPAPPAQHSPVWPEPVVKSHPRPRWAFFLGAFAFLAVLPLLRRRKRRAGSKGNVSSPDRVIACLPDDKVGSGVPGDVKGYEGIIAKKEGYWSLSGASGRYRFDPVSGWLTSFDSGEKFGCFICKKIQPHPLQFASSFSKVTSLKILSSEIMTEIQRKENAGALFVLPSQLNGAEYPSHTHVVKEVEEYKRDNTGGPRGQLAAHPAAAQFILDNAAKDGCTGGINSIDEILFQVGPNFELVNGYLKIRDLPDSNAEAETLGVLESHLNTLRPLIMEDLPAKGLMPDKKAFADCTHKVGLVYASAVPVDSYMNQGGKTDFQAKVAELILVGQYYGALRYAAESEKEKGPGRPRRKVFLMPLGGGVFNNPWDIIGKSMAKAVQMLDDDLLALLDVSALVWNRNPSEEQNLKLIFGKLRSHPVPGLGKTQLFRIATGQPDEDTDYNPAHWKRMMSEMSEVSDRPLILEEQTEIFRMQTESSAPGHSPRSPRQGRGKSSEAPIERKELEMLKEDEVAKSGEEGPRQETRKAKKLAEESKKAQAALKTEEEEEERRKAEEAGKAEERRKAQEAFKAEERRKAEEAEKAEERRKAETALKAEERRKAQEALKAEERKKAQEALKAEERRKAQEALKAEERKKAEEALKAEERRKAEEAGRAEERRKAQEALKAEERRKAEEALKAEERRNAEEAGKAEERRKAQEALKAEERRKAEEVLKAEEGKKAQEALKAEEARKAEEAKRIEQTRTAEEATETKELNKSEEARKADEVEKARKAEEQLKHRQAAFLSSAGDVQPQPKVAARALRSLESGLTKTPDQPRTETPRRGLNSSLVGNPGQNIRQIARQLETNQPPTYSPATSRVQSPTKASSSRAAA
eukprot:g17779.t1